VATKPRMFVGQTTREQLLDMLPADGKYFFVYEHKTPTEIAIHALLPVDDEDNLSDVLRASVVADALEDNSHKVLRRNPGLLKQLKVRLGKKEPE